MVEQQEIEATSGLRDRLGRAARLIRARAVAVVERGAGDAIHVLGSWGLEEEDAASLERSLEWLDEALAEDRPLVRFDGRAETSEIAIAPLRGRLLAWARIHPPELLTDHHLELLRELADAAWEIERLTAEPGEPGSGDGAGDDSGEPGARPASPSPAPSSPAASNGAGATTEALEPEAVARLLAGPVLSSGTTLGTYLIRAGRLAHVNATLAKRLGYSPEEVVGRDALAIVHPEDRAKVARKIEERRGGRVERVTYTFRAVSRDGGVVHLEAHGGTLRLHGEPALGGVVVDVTSRTRALEALRASESRFARIVALSRDATLYLESDGTVVLFNTAAERLFGVTARDALGRSLEEVSPEVAAAVASHDEEHPALPRTAEVRRRDGSAFWAEVWAAAGGRGEEGELRVVMVRDVTEQRRHERARDRLLRLERDERFRAEVSHMRAQFLDDLTAELAASPPDPPTILSRLVQLAIPVAADYALCYRFRDDAPPDVLAAATMAATRLAVLEDPPALPELSWEEEPGGWLCSPGADPRVRAFFDHHARRHEARAVQLLPLLDGERAHGVLVLGHTYHVTDSELATLGQLGRDVATRVSMILEHGRLYHDARTAARLRDQVLAVVSHDLRNPLNVIGFTTDSLLRHWPEDPAEMEAVRRQVGVMRRSAERAKRLVRDLLDYAQIEAGILAVDPVPCDTAALLREARDFRRPLADQRSIRLEIQLDDDLPAVLADAERVLQVLGNLLDNAFRHTPPESAVRLRAAAAGDTVRIEVEDEGPGVPADERERIFDRFSRGRGGGKVGAGLGLAIARGIVAAHGGTLEVTGPAHQGATFRFTLPVA